MTRRKAETDEKTVPCVVCGQPHIPSPFYQGKHSKCSVGKACKYIAEYIVGGVQGPLIDESVDDLPDDVSLRELKARAEQAERDISAIRTVITPHLSEDERKLELVAAVFSLVNRKQLAPYTCMERDKALLELTEERARLDKLTELLRAAINSARRAKPE